MAKDFYKHYRFHGTHREVGRQHGEALRESIQGHLALIYELARKNSGVEKERALQIARLYEPFIGQYAPGFLEELAGLGEGAGITPQEALLLQIRQEVVNLARHGAAECSSYAIGSAYTADGEVYSGQNADLSGDFEDITNVVTFAVEGKPRIMMAVPAGQISYIGMNEEGMACNCNFLPCNGWRKGYPRYLISRLVLEQRTFEEGCAKLESIRVRASSRNILVTDYRGNFADYETIADDYGRIRGGDFFVHTNHFLHPDMLKYETSDAYEMEDSVLRLERFTQLIEANKGSISAKTIRGFLRDHGDGGPYSICMHPSEHNSYHTFVSVVNHLTSRYMEVAVGYPCQHEFAIYEF